MTRDRLQLALDHTDAWMRLTRLRRAAFGAYAHDRDQGAEWAGSRTVRSVGEGVRVDRALSGFRHPAPAGRAHAGV